MYKARALQYCLEADVTVLPDDSWIVHLDEETLLTTNAVSFRLKSNYNIMIRFRCAA